MKHPSPESDDQLHIESDLFPENSEGVYSLEEIMREFGGWSKAEPEEAAPSLAAQLWSTPEPDEETESDILPLSERIPPKPEPEAVPEPGEMSAQNSEVIRIAAFLPEKEDTSEKSEPLTDLAGDTIRFAPITQDDLEKAEANRQPPAEPVLMPEEPEEDRAEERHRLKLEAEAQRRERKYRRKQLRMERRMERIQRRNQPEIIFPTPEEACAVYSKIGILRKRLALSILLAFANMAMVLLSETKLGALDLTGLSGPMSLAMLAIMLAQSLLSFDVFVDGVYQALQLRFTLNSMLVLTTALIAADSFSAIPHGRVPLCAVASLEMLLSLWSRKLEYDAKRRTLKTILSMENPVAAVRAEKTWHNLDCLFRQDGNLDDFTAMLETPDATQKVMRFYAPLMTVATFSLAMLSYIRSNTNFLWAWSVLLAAALPAGAFLSCSRPFAIVARRLRRAGAALCGWQGAKLLSGECGMVICDSDLFTKQNITMNGMKMYSELPVRQVVGYATAVLQAAGSGLLDLFEEVMKTEDGRRYSVDSFRQYEGGGLGAEIRGDVVLLGSLPFMRLMGVPIPEGIRIHAAVYISVNRELAGVFALTYTPSAASKTSLQSILRSTGLIPILATRDFMITPALIKKRYKVSADRLEFPVVAERVRLSAPEAGEGGRQCALMTRGSFYSFSTAVAGGRMFRRAVHGALWISVLSGLMGITLLCIMTYLNAQSAASAMNLLLYQLLWFVPTFLITTLIGKS